MFYDLVVPLSSPGCEFRFGIYPETDGCSTKYVKCADGYPNLLDCEPGLAYDDRIRKCNWPDQLQEICKPEGINFLRQYTEIINVLLSSTV